jgi:hypothetical protein
MTSPRHPAAYIRVPGASARRAMLLEAGQRGWPAPEIYAEDEPAADDSYGPALHRLEAAIVAGRHDALLMSAPGDPGLLMRLLSHCTKHGVAVSFLPGAGPIAAGSGPAHESRGISATVSGATGSGATGSGATGSGATVPDTGQALASAAASASVGESAHAAPSVNPSSESWDVLAQARLEALAGLFPDWRVWLDRSGWHARRRDSFVQGYRPGAPAFHVTAANALDLAAQLCWQQAAETHTPDGCQASMLCPPPWGSLTAADGRSA